MKHERAMLRGRHRELLMVLLAAGAAGSLPAAAAMDILVQAEDALVGGASPRPGYGFIDPRDEVANWASINCSPSPGFPNAPGRFGIDFGSLPPGPYVVWARIARWGGTPDTAPIPAAAFADGQGHGLDYTFPKSADDPLGTCFAMRPGGMVPPEGEWAWLRLFGTGSIRGRYELTVTGDPGPVGTGNYKGLWVDAFRFEATGASRAPRLPEDTTLPGQYARGPYISTLSPRQGSLSVAFPGTAPPSPPNSGGPEGASPAASARGAPLLRRSFTRPLDASRKDHLSLWMQATAQVGSPRLVLKDARGRQVSADVCQLADDRPLRPGRWYYLVWALKAGARRSAPGSGGPASTDLRRLAALEVQAGAGTSVPEAGLCLHDPRLLTAAEARKAPPAAGLTEAAASSMRDTFAVLAFPRKAVGRERKVILWAAHSGTGGIPTPAVVRPRIKDLYASGADGIVVTVNPIVDGKELYFADEFLSSRRFAERDFAAQLVDLRAIEWGPLDHSLLRLDVMPGTVDWFEAGWSAVSEKAGLAARMAKAGHLAGIMFDVEQYHWDRGIFRYDNRPLKAEKSLADYVAQAGLRGREMAAAMAAEFPGIDVLTTFGGSIGADGGELLMAFLEGMASVPGCRVYDGCEPAYPFRTLRRFLEATRQMRGISSKVGTGFGIWVNHPAGPYSAERPEGNYQSPEGLAHALHYALRLSDKYVWLYREQPLTFWPEATPAAYYDAIKRARAPQDPGWVPPR